MREICPEHFLVRVPSGPNKEVKLPPLHMPKAAVGLLLLGKELLSEVVGVKVKKDAKLSDVEAVSLLEVLSLRLKELVSQV